MSYILDALRKSEQQRQQGAAPIDRLNLATETAPARSAISINGVLATALVCAGISIGWLRPWQSEPPMPAPKVIIAASSVPSPPSASSESSAPSVQPTAPATRLPPPMEQPSQGRIVPVMAPPAQAAQVSLPRDITVAKPESPPADPAPPPAQMPLDELPDTVRREVPDIAISLHSYSDVANESIVMINGALLHEGEAIAPGFRLERITPDGVVIGYKGYRIRRGLR